LAQREVLFAYLLQQLPSEQIDELEKRFFEDDTFTAELLDAEDALMNSYLSGKLEEPQKSRFEEIYLGNPARKEHFEMYKTLRERQK
jgi:hypothetical protein